MEISRLVSLVAPAESASTEIARTHSPEPAFTQLLLLIRGATPRGPLEHGQSPAARTSMEVEEDVKHPEAGQRSANTDSLGGPQAELDPRPSTLTNPLVRLQPEGEDERVTSQGHPREDDTQRSTSSAPASPEVLDWAQGIPCPEDASEASMHAEYAGERSSERTSSEPSSSAVESSTSTKEQESSTARSAPPTPSPSVESASPQEPGPARAIQASAEQASVRPADQASVSPAVEAPSQAHPPHSTHRAEIAPDSSRPDAESHALAEDDVERPNLRTIAPHSRLAYGTEKSDTANHPARGPESLAALSRPVDLESAPTSARTRAFVGHDSELALRTKGEPGPKLEVTDALVHRAPTNRAPGVEWPSLSAPPEIEAAGAEQAARLPASASFARVHMSATAREVLSRVFDVAVGGGHRTAAAADAADDLPLPTTDDGSTTTIRHEASSAFERNATTREQGLRIDLEETPAKVAAPLLDAQDGPRSEPGLQRAAPDAPEQAHIGTEVGRLRLADAPHSEAPVLHPRRTEAWLDALLRRPAQFSTDRDGTSVLRLTIDEQSGVMTLRTRHEGDRMVVSVAFSDAGLHAAAQDDAANIRNALQQLFDAAVDLSFTNQERHGEKEASGTPDQGVIGRPEIPPRGIAEPDDDPRSRSRRAIGGRHEWIG